MIKINTPKNGWKWYCECGETGIVAIGDYPSLCRDCLLNFIDELKQALAESGRV